MIKFDSLSTILCCCDIIFEIKYPRAESEDLHTCYPYKLLHIPYPYKLIVFLGNNLNVGNKAYFLSADEHKSFQQADSISLVVHSQG